MRCGSFRITDGASGRGYISATIFWICRLVLWTAREQPVAVVRGEGPDQDGDAADMESPVGEHLQQDGMPPRRPGHADPAEGLALGEVQDPRAVPEHRRAGEAGVETPDVDLGDMGDERGLGATGPAGYVGERGKELVVRE